MGGLGGPAKKRPLRGSKIGSIKVEMAGSPGTGTFEYGVFDVDARRIDSPGAYIHGR